MTKDSCQVVVDLHIHTVAGSDYPVVTVTLPSTKLAVFEILMYAPDKMCIHADQEEEKLTLLVDDLVAVYIDNRNGHLEQFKKLLDTEQLFAFTLTTCAEGTDGTLYVLTRTILAENTSGRILSNTGPQKMAYDEAYKKEKDNPELHVIRHSFTDAVALAVSKGDTLSKRSNDNIGCSN